ncbi:MAG: PDZ domain-containing protein [Planctomycetes bacterium]|nr:PDZ domain-containing protein [Planctomycetota bacterium]
MMHQRTFRLATAALVIALASRCALAQDGSRYTAVFRGGQRISEKEISDWGFPNSNPRIKNVLLFAPANPVVWISHNTTTPVRSVEAYIEFTSGDRLPGELLQMVRGVGDVRSVTLGDHLVVRPAVSLKNTRNQAVKQIRVVPRFVRRIVWQGGGAGPYRPGTLIYRDGRTAKFRRHRFGEKFVELLFAEETGQVLFDEIAELHLPAADVWNAYYDEVAALSPDLKTRLFQIETTTGLIATASPLRFAVAPFSNRANADFWHHVIQPAWSLDAFAVLHRDVRMRRYFLPHEVPLSRITSRITPSGGMAVLGTATWHPQVNRNVHGGRLRSGGNLFGWGVGVHGRSSLEFPLPPAARMFRTRLGLDRRVGRGGCVKGIVQLKTRAKTAAAETAQLKLLFQTRPLVGSQAVADTGNVTLPVLPAGARRSLILEVDPLHKGRPAGADPLDVRDTLDWLEPVLTLDTAMLGNEVRRRLNKHIPAWDGWSIDPDTALALKMTSYSDAQARQGSSFRFLVVPAGKSLLLSRRMTITPKQRWLVVSASDPLAGATNSIIELRVDGEVMADYDVPARLSGQAEPQPLAVSLAALIGREVQLDLIHRPKNPAAAIRGIDWRAIVFSEYLPTVRALLEDTGRLVLVKDMPEDKQPEEKPAAKPDKKDEKKKWGRGQFVKQDAYSGAACVKITPPGKFRLDLPGLDAAIRADPDWGEYRYIRFAFRKQGKGPVLIDYGHDRAGALPFRHDAGPVDPQDKTAQRMSVYSPTVALPDSWIVMTRDLFVDFGSQPFNLRSISFGCPGGESALLDHIYLARRKEDFELLDVPRSASPEEANKAARRETAKFALERGLPAAVLITASGASFSGITVSEDGYVLTAGHTMAGLPREVTVVLRDGRKVQGQTLGIDRALDVGMIKIKDVGKYAFVEQAPAAADRQGQLLLAIAHQIDYQPGQRPLAHLTVVRGSAGGLHRSNFREKVIGSGGPLLDVAVGTANGGKLVGIHSRNGLDGYLYVPIEKIQPSLERMKKGEIWGAWPGGAGPLIGVHVTTGGGECRIIEIIKGGPGEQAQLRAGDRIAMLDATALRSREDLLAALGKYDPGRQVTLKILRGGNLIQAKLVLGRRP